MIIPSRPRAFALALAVAAASGGALVAIHYHHLGLTLSHYDARGHLVVARRIADSLTPGWQQIGAVWLPLPHVLNAAPVQIDAFYRTGASAVAISIAAFAIATFALAWLIQLITGSRWAAVAGIATFALNPNVLYLQATPMTEPLLIAAITLGVAMLTASLQNHTADLKGRATGVIFSLACLTRYEAWPVTFSALGLALLALRRTGVPWREAVRRVGAVAVYPALSILAFAVFSRVVIGEWLVTGGFFVPENTALGHPFEAFWQIGWGVRALSGYALLTAAAIGLVGLVIIAWRDRPRAWVLVSLSLAATAAVPWAAFLRGHPYRIRYMIPLIAAEALGVGMAAGLVKRARPPVAIALMLIVSLELRPLDAGAPMVVEAQWDRPNMAVRQHVTECLRRRAPGDAVMASMGSLGHYMQELATTGHRIGDFLHEGNGDIWLAALEHPHPYAGWILIEEQAEGGDMLAHMARENPTFLDGFSRVCEGAGLALYRRE